MSSENESNVENVSTVEEKGMKTSRAVIYGVCGVAFSILVAFVIARVVIPKMEHNKAVDELKNMSLVGELTPYNKEVIQFSGGRIEEASIEHKALGINGAPTTPPAFIFYNGIKAENRSVVNLYVDFGEQRSRDVILLNAPDLKALVSAGTIELHIHAILTGNPVSTYTAESLAEIFATQPDKSWDSLIELLKKGSEMDGMGLEYDEILNEIVGTVNKLGVDDVTADTVKNGAYVKWLLSLGNAPELSVGMDIPRVTANNVEINIANNIDFSVNDEFRSIVFNT